MKTLARFRKNDILVMTFSNSKGKIKTVVRHPNVSNNAITCVETSDSMNKGWESYFKWRTKIDRLEYQRGKTLSEIAVPSEKTESRIFNKIKITLSAIVRILFKNHARLLEIQDMKNGFIRLQKVGYQDYLVYDFKTLSVWAISTYWGNLIEECRFELLDDRDQDEK